MKIRLEAECFQSEFKDDTFWCWFLREFPNASINQPNPDVIIRYGTLGASEAPAKTIALLWELYPEMQRALGVGYDAVNKLYEAAAFSKIRTTASEIMVADYDQFGPVDVLPIGVDTDIFKPNPYKKELRRKWGIPENARVGFWIGTTHPMKGFDRLLAYALENPDIFWVCVWKWERESSYLPNGLNLMSLPQIQIAELMNASDFTPITSRLRPYYMVEWEAMACNLTPVNISGLVKDFVPSANPRSDVFDWRWDRPHTKLLWEELVQRI